MGTYMKCVVCYMMPVKGMVTVSDRNSRVNMTLRSSDFEATNQTNSEAENTIKSKETVMNSDDNTCSLARLECTCARGKLTAEELHAADNVLSKSVNSVLFLLPNHHIDHTGLLRGYKFDCHAEERATVLPFNKEMFDLIAMYECKIPKNLHPGHSRVNPHAMRIFNNHESCQAMIKAYMDSYDCSLPSSNKIKHALFDCIRDEISSTRFTQQVPDKRTWRTSKPARVGLFHAYIRTHRKDAIEHKMFIVVSGCLKMACEELENIWQDIHDKVSCKNFVESEECHWLRIATMRNHNRIAYDIAKILDLKVETRLDLDDPSRKQYMALGTTYSFKSDMYVTDNEHVQVVDMGCFLNRSHNGILFEMHGNEGYWLFTGPKDYASDYTYGLIAEQTKHMNFFPTQTLAFNMHYTVQNYSNVVKVLDTAVDSETVLTDSENEIKTGKRFYYFPDEDFMKTLEHLGYNRNDSVLHLMPIICCGD